MADAHNDSKRESEHPGAPSPAEVQSTPLPPAALQTALQEIYRQFPEFSGQSEGPALETVRPQNGAGKPVFLLTFRLQALTGTGEKLSRRLRVTLDAQGQIIKTVTSH